MYILKIEKIPEDGSKNFSRNIRKFIFLKSKKSLKMEAKILVETPEKYIFLKSKQSLKMESKILVETRKIYT